MRTALGLVLKDRCDSTRLVDSAQTDEYGLPVTSRQAVLAETMRRWQPKGARSHYDEYRKIPVFQDSVMLPLWADVEIDDTIGSIREMSGFVIAQERTVDSVVRRQTHKLAYLRGRNVGAAQGHAAPIDIPETPLTPSDPVTPPATVYYYLGLKATDTPDAADFTEQSQATAIDIPIDQIPAGERRFFFYAKPQSQGAFSRAYYYQTGNPTSINTYGTQFVDGTGTIMLNGVQYIWVRSRIGLRRPSSARTLDAA